MADTEAPTLCELLCEEVSVMVFELELLSVLDEDFSSVFDLDEATSMVTVSDSVLSCVMVTISDSSVVLVLVMPEDFSWVC